MKHKFEKKYLLLVIILIIGIMIGGNIYLSHMRDALWEQSVKNVLEVTAQGGKSFEVYIDSNNYMLLSRAANFAQFASTDTESIRYWLDLYDEGDPSFSIIDLTNGKLYFNSEESTDISDEKLDKYRALSEKGLLEPFISEYDGRRVIGYYEKFTFLDGAEGMVCKTVLLSEVSKRFTLSFYDGEGFSYIVDDVGDILLRSVNDGGNLTFNNVFDVVALDDNTEDDVEVFRAGMSDKKRGVMRLKFNGEEHIFAFVPLNVTEDWYLVSIIPNDIIMESANKMMMRSQVMFFVIAAVILIFAVFVLVSTRYRRQISAKETEVKYREQMFNILANNTNDVFMMVGTDGAGVKYVSPNVERVMGVLRDEVERDVSALQGVIHGIENIGEVTDNLDIPLDGFDTFEGKYLHKKTGEMRWFVETIYHTIIEDMERYIAIFADRTEERQKEAALTEALEIARVANESKSTFLANMSHDIRTPMNAIVGFATLLQRDAENPDKVREYTEKITSSSQHLLALINDVLDMSKIENGKTSLNVGEFNLGKLIQELDSIIRLQAKAKKQTFEIAVSDIQHENLIGDKQRISQVLINILSNAVKYTSEGGNICMTVTQLGQVTQDIVRLSFVVTDNGIGMSKEYQEEIFKPFTREIRTTVNQIQGTGLGMAITKNLVELMGGTISVSSMQGEGSTFTIELDLRVASTEDDVDFWKENNISRAMIVDDEIDICTEILSTMSTTGVDMQFALDGPTAIEMAVKAKEEKKDFDVILLDLKMPDMDGYETARQLRAKIPSNIPILLLTAYDFEEIREEGIAIGIDGFMAKPFFISNFKEAIRNIKKQEPKANENDGDISGRHFLCVEDNELNAEIIVELLNMKGATSEVAVNGLEAVEKFTASKNGTYDAILMDIQMPVMNGYEATKAIRSAAHDEAKTIPIVAMTANAFADDVRASLQSGMNAHIAKPVDMNKLVQVLYQIWNENSGK